MTYEDLTQHQKDCLKEVGNFLRSGKKMFTLKGSAGTGKTTLARVMIDMLKGQKVMNITAPTNKAVKILAQGTAKHPNTYYSTTHSYLKLKELINPDGSLSFERRVGDVPSTCDILVIDECSMVGKNLMSYIHDLHGKTKVIFIGDPKQINPVGEKLSPTFDVDGFELVEILRQKANSPILDFVYDFSRIAPRNSCDKFIITANNGDFVSAIKDKDIEKTIGWTNKYVDGINEWHRRRIYGDKAVIEFLVGENLILSAPAISPEDGKTVLFSNSEELEVLSADKYSENGMLIWAITAKGEGGMVADIFIPAKESLPLYERALKALASEAKELVKKKVNPGLAWANFYEFKNQFADVKYSYAITAHKSQGSTYRSVAVNMRDIFRNPDRVERDRILYTALTRASDTVLCLI